MRISTKGRYGMAAMLCLAEKNGQNMTVAEVSDKLGISKIYLEQVFSLLKKSGLVQSVKGAQGGYFINGGLEKITAYDILKATESGLFESAEPSTGNNKSDYIENTLRKMLWEPLDLKICETLQSITLQAMLNNAKDKSYMFYI